jgi:hypothetical protein
MRTGTYPLIGTRHRSALSINPDRAMGEACIEGPLGDCITCFPECVGFDGPVVAGDP